MRTTRRSRSALLASLLFATACVAVRELSARERGDPVEVRHARTLERRAARVPTDSLARLYMVALDAPEEQGGALLDAVSCQRLRLDWAYGRGPARIAVARMTDSLFATPALRERWEQAQGRWPIAGGVDFSCVRGLVPAPDSLSE
ncbi:MAG: hypothetical protein HOQ12_02835 [Gemmatimonadaceae bacterium]|nr:hypothetical protein [Gemmatimonadaceae bacterium]